MASDLLLPYEFITVDGLYYRFVNTNLQSNKSRNHFLLQYIHLEFQSKYLFHHYTCTCNTLEPNNTNKENLPYNVWHQKK